MRMRVATAILLHAAVIATASIPCALGATAPREYRFVSRAKGPAEGQASGVNRQVLFDPGRSPGFAGVGWSELAGGVFWPFAASDGSLDAKEMSASFTIAGENMPPVVAFARARRTDGAARADSPCGEWSVSVEGRSRAEKEGGPASREAAVSGAGRALLCGRRLTPLAAEMRFEGRLAPAIWEIGIAGADSAYTVEVAWAALP
ncbi:MAG: hypothetical protein JXA24_07295 [Proteobacteria bacterium]|nr:hypothetical protein [Pseudomonadota bacterium]